jgi:hypothetical protein
LNEPEPDITTSDPLSNIVAVNPEDGIGVSVGVGVFVGVSLLVAVGVGVSVSVGVGVLVGVTHSTGKPILV